MQIQSISIILLWVWAASAELAQVVSIFRHGARYTINSLYDGNDTKYIWGELSPAGMRQHQTFGQILREQYINKLRFLSPQYNPTQIEVFSTAINRTIQSVSSQLFGLYPTGSGPSLSNVTAKYHLPPFSNSSDLPGAKFALPLGYQAIPIKFDQRVAMDSCINQGSEMDKNIQVQLDEYREMNTTYWPFIRRMAALFNLTGNVTLGTISNLNAGVDCDQHLGRPLPANFTVDDQTNLKHIDSWYKQFVLSRTLAKAISRPKLIKIMSMFDSRIKNVSQTLKWTLISAHDVDLCSLYNDLNLSSSKCVEQKYRTGKTGAANCEQYPAFASSLIFELYTDGLIRIRSNGVYMKLCGTNRTQCTYADWRDRVVNNLASEKQSESICGKKYNTKPATSTLHWSQLRKQFQPNNKQQT